VNQQLEEQSNIFNLIKPRRIAVVAIAVLAVGAVFYHVVEKLSWLDSFYFCVVTLTTVGYGDITPKTPAAKLFTIFYILFGVAIMAASLSYLLKAAVVKRVKK
jgi:voltage-gated potassium channel